MSISTAVTMFFVAANIFSAVLSLSGNLSASVGLGLASFLALDVVAENKQ